MPKFFIKTYGCQMNERDSEQVAHSLIARGYERVANEREADVVLLNTCSVRDMADQKALGKMGMMGRMAKERPHMVFGFLGCMAQARGESLLKNLPHVDLVVGTQKFHHVADYVQELVASKTARSAIVSIMQGCNMHCTFCIVPQTRGAERSRSIDEIVREVRDLVAHGVKEVTLLGQIVNLYGRHEFPKRDGKTPFVQLLEAVNEIEGLERLRFTSPHPIGFRNDLIDAISHLPKLAEHVHLPLQSASNRILRAMHRAYTVEKYVDLVRRVRHAREGIAITTDIIVGFPGETEEDYKQTRDLVEELQFDNAFVFRYSQRRHTPAAEMPDQIDEHIKEERNRDLLRVVDEATRQSGERLVGSNVRVLCEGPSKTNPTRLMGRTRTNKIVVFEGNEKLIGETVDVHVQRANGFSLYGTLLLKDHNTFKVASAERRVENSPAIRRDESAGPHYRRQ